MTTPTGFATLLPAWVAFTDEAAVGTGIARAGSWVTTTDRGLPEASELEGLVAVLRPDGELRHLGQYRDGRRVCILDVFPLDDLACFQAYGPTVAAGEVYRAGTVTTLSSWHDTDDTRTTEEGFASWVKRHVARVLEMSREGRPT